MFKSLVEIHVESHFKWNTSALEDDQGDFVYEFGSFLGWDVYTTADSYYKEHWQHPQSSLPLMHFRSLVNAKVHTKVFWKYHRILNYWTVPEYNEMNLFNKLSRERILLEVFLWSRWKTHWLFIPNGEASSGSWSC